MKRLALIGLGLLVVTTTGCVAQPPEHRRIQREQCWLPQKGVLPMGFVAEEGGKSYRCVAILDSNFKPMGGAWVEVVKDYRLPY